ncbi:uncharacterized protein HGUI_01713 [Hanseniaspora guilliermondii]|uniref:Uncharacterized protein n=1 Tax=Hanseniaspora guilliermondii TaxID=56406 RepID=A0A1L0CM66_9ASCO|nr:uncharacterized protein HGUI_01713 [Hanseniaspora guilliermondii]
MFRPTLRLLQESKKNKTPVPMELAPLFTACAVALCSLTYFSYKKLRYDEGLRIINNPNQSLLGDVVDLDSKTEVIDIHNKETYTEAK